MTSLKALLITAVAAGAFAQPPCTPEKVNDDCRLRLDRYYPVAQPTIQVRTGKRVTVIVANPLPFETVTLDFQSAQAVIPTDPTQAMVTALLGQAKSLAIVSMVSPNFIEPAPPETTDYAGAMKKANEIKSRLDALVTEVSKFIGDATGVYTELSEVVQTISPETFAGHWRLPELVTRGTPRPWQRFDLWRAWMLCEIGTCPGEPRVTPPVSGLLGSAAYVTNDLTTAVAVCSNSSAGSADCQIKDLAAINTTAFSDAEKSSFAAMLAFLRTELGALQAANVAVAAVSKDLGSYYVNIMQYNPPAPGDINLGSITDPAATADTGAFVSKLLGRQVVFAANAVNQVATPVSSVPSSGQKKPIATITVVFGDPIVEASAGAFFSFLPNRSFSNQTAVTQNPGSIPTTGNIYIAQTKTIPTVVPFAAANLRLGHDFLIGRRRGAFYLTAAVGINAFNSNTEFGLGPSFSWRSLMFTAFWHEGHDVRLAQGEYVGEVWCNSSGAAGSIPKCGGNPPGPSTEKFWTPAFAIGVSVRIPAVFGSGSSGH